MGQRYYLFSGDAGADYTTLRSMMESMNILPYPDTKFTKDGSLIRVKEKITLEHPVYFLYVEQTHEQGYDHNTYTIPCVIHNIHDSSTISTINNKANLHEAMRDSKFIAKSWPMEKFAYTSGVYIMRPSHILAFAGRDIRVISSAEEFEHAKQFYEKKKREFAKGSSRLRDYRVIVSEYIKDPMLFRNRKFHLRIYINTVASHEKLMSCSMAFQNGEILTGALPYVQSDWNNKLIHDTHGETTDGNYTFPRDYPGRLDNLWPQLGQLLGEIKALCSHHRPFSQAQYSQHLFGIDVMVQADDTIKLLEINSGAGLGDGKYRNTDDGRAYYKTLNMWLWQTGMRELCEFSIANKVPRRGLKFITCGHGPDYFPFLRQELERVGFVNAGHLSPNDNPPARIDLLLVSTIDTGIQKNVWNLPTVIENLYDVKYAQEITNKAILHKNTNKYWHLVARTLDWADFNYTGGRFIIRPSGHLWSSGLDITIIDTLQDYYACKDKYDKISKKYPVIVSDLFDNLVLFNGLKFHIRAYLLIHNFGGLTVKFAPIAKILTASKPYNNTNFDDKEIHDTHLSSTADDYLFPEDFPVRELVAPIQVQMRQMAESILQCVSQNGMRPYTNAQVAYEIFGVDLMVTSDGELVLIEINDMVGYTAKNPTSPSVQDFYKKRALWEWNEILYKLIRAHLSV